MIDSPKLAAELFDAARTANPVPFLTERYPNLTWSDARAIALATDELRLADGEQLIGYKLGWTSSAMREALGIERPNWGTLWASQVRTGVLVLDDFIHPKLEPELVWRASTDLEGDDVTESDVVSSGGRWALGIEVVDPRFPSFDFDFLDNTSDNSSSAAIGLGLFSRIPAESVGDIEVQIDDGSEPRVGIGSNAMGSPTEAVAWLVRELAAEGSALRAGHLVYTGGLTAPFDATAGVTYTLASEALDSVELRVV